VTICTATGASALSLCQFFDQSGQLTDGQRVFQGFCTAVFWGTLMYQTAPDVELPSYQLPE
jgi:hypothetical protein